MRCTLREDNKKKKNHRARFCYFIITIVIIIPILSISFALLLVANDRERGWGGGIKNSIALTDLQHPVHAPSLQQLESLVKG